MLALPCSKAEQGKQPLMDMKQAQLFSYEILAPGFARAPEDGTGLAWQVWDRQCRQSLPARCPYLRQPPHAVPSLLSCNCQVSAPASGALGVPEHPAALGIPEYPTALGVPERPTALHVPEHLTVLSDPSPTAQGAGGSPRSGRSRDPFQPLGWVLPSFLPSQGWELGQVRGHPLGTCWSGSLSRTWVGCGDHRDG